MIRRFLLILFSLFSFGCMLVLLFLLLPSLFHLFLQPRLTSSLPFEEAHIELLQVTPGKLKLSASLGTAALQAIDLPKVTISFDPKRFTDRELGSLVLDSATLRFVEHNGIFQLPGLKTTPASAAPGVLPGLPLAIPHLILKNFRLFLEMEDGRSLQFNLDGAADLEFSTLPDSSKRLTRATLHLNSSGAVDARAELTLQGLGEGYALTGDIAGQSLEQLTSLTKTETKAKTLQGISGGFELKIALNLSSHLQIKDYRINMLFPGLQITSGGQHIVDSTNTDVTSVILAGDLKRASFNIAKLRTMFPKPGTVRANGEIDLEHMQAKGSGRISLPDLGDPLDLKFAARLKENETIVDWNLSCKKLQWETYLLKGLTGSGKMTSRKKNIQGEITLALDTVEVPEFDLQFQKTKLLLPFSSQAGQQYQTRNAHFSIAQILYKNTKTAELTATAHSEGNRILISSLLHSSDMPKLSLRCQGIADGDSALTADCQLDKTLVRSEQLPKWLAIPDTLEFSGVLGAKAHYSLTGKSGNGQLLIKLEDGELISGTNHLQGINTSLSLPRLPQLQSAPGQVLTIDSIDLGRLKLTKARISYRLEDQQTLQIIKSRMHWCQGTVESGGFQLTPNTKELATTLYCDRLRFSELLDQFGVADTEGDGSLNGRLPIVISDKTIHFEDGFLFSTPGNSGIVRFNNAGQLRQGMPAAGQSGSLDYSMKALEQFSYNWTKLNFNSDGEDLILNLQLDGKPAQPLPFGYKNGRIVPMSEGKGLQHPIRLDVNFRLPLQEMFRYGKDIQSIMENM